MTRVGTDPSPQSSHPADLACRWHHNCAPLALVHGRCFSVAAAETEFDDPNDDALFSMSAESYSRRTGWLGILSRE
jgi:hypothetical protein